jgi:AraC-like DNA-binding protein
VQHSRRVSGTDSPPPFEPCGLARLPLILLHHAGGLGLDRAELMRRAGFHDDDLRDPDARVPIRKFWALWQMAVDETGDEGLALRVFSSTPLRQYGLVGYLMTNCGTLGQALDRLARYSRLVTEAVRLHWEHDGTSGRIAFAGTSGEPRRASDSRLAFLVTAARELTARPLIPRDVQFPYPRPQDVTFIEATLGSNLSFDRPQAAILFEGHDVDLAVVGADPTLGRYLDNLADRLLEAMPAAAEFQDRAGRAIWAALREGRADLESVAARLAVSPRTLQRRLQAEGSSYAGLLDTVRRELAIGLLRERTLAVYEVAFLLGYSEPSTFHRAFRRWMGTSPRAYRESVG